MRNGVSGIMGKDRVPPTIAHAIPSQKIVWRNVTFFAIFKGERILRNGLDRNFVWCFIFIERG